MNNIDTRIEMNANRFYRFLMGTDLMIPYIESMMEHSSYWSDNFVDEHREQLEDWLFGKDDPE